MKPTACGGDKAVQILKLAIIIVMNLFLTSLCQIWGAGSNDQYQIQPNGATYYQVAVQIIVTDTVYIDNINNNNNQSCGITFNGTLNQLNCPVIPAPDVCCRHIRLLKV